MTESLSQLPGSHISSIPATPRHPSRWRRAAFAGTLSFFFTGMGQLYNRQPRRALILGVVSCLSTLLMAHGRLLLSFRSMIMWITAASIWKIAVVADSVFSAGRSESEEARVPVPWIIYSALAVMLFVGAIIPSPDTVKEKSGVGAFKIPSSSMCPTICVGDRIVVDLHAYRSQEPQRGDVIVMKHASSEALFVKRVIGVPGDVVSPGPDGTVLVNGQPFLTPQSCAEPAWHKTAGADYSEFGTTRVSDGNYFVVGDNLPNSYDSRIGAFGRVTRDMVRGRPLYLYWSPTWARVGCSVH